MAKLIDVAAQPGYKLRLRYDDGVAGDVNLSHLVGDGVFAAWNDASVFQAVSIGPHGEIRWTDAIEMCADAMYLEISGKAPEDLFPSLKAPADA